VIAAQANPHHATIARFVERHQDALAGVFGEVLGLCASAGLVGLKVVAVDGSKVAANASCELNVDYERLAREVIEDARAVDADAARGCRPTRATGTPSRSNGSPATASPS
jgi:hypothetical protein